MNGAKTGFTLLQEKYVLPAHDPRAAKTRMQLRREQIRMGCSKTIKWSLHLSEEEFAALCSLNPDTLGNPDQALNDKAWADFIDSPQSSAYRVQG